jgi:hypothetical protein
MTPNLEKKKISLELDLDTMNLDLILVGIKNHITVHLFKYIKINLSSFILSINEQN